MKSLATCLAYLSAAALAAPNSRGGDKQARDTSPRSLSTLEERAFSWQCLPDNYFCYEDKSCCSGDCVGVRKLWLFINLPGRCSRTSTTSTSTTSRPTSTATTTSLTSGTTTSTVTSSTSAVVTSESSTITGCLATGTRVIMIHTTVDFTTGELDRWTVTDIYTVPCSASHMTCDRTPTSTIVTFTDNIAETDPNSYSYTSRTLSYLDCESEQPTAPPQTNVDTTGVGGYPTGSPAQPTGSGDQPPAQTGGSGGSGGQPPQQTGGSGSQPPAQTGGSGGQPPQQTGGSGGSGGGQSAQPTSPGQPPPQTNNPTQPTSTPPTTCLPSYVTTLVPTYYDLVTSNSLTTSTTRFYNSVTQIFTNNPDCAIFQPATTQCATIQPSYITRTIPTYRAITRPGRRPRYKNITTVMTYTSYPPCTLDPSLPPPTTGTATNSCVTFRQIELQLTTTTVRRGNGAPRPTPTFVRVTVVRTICDDFQGTSTSTSSSTSSITSDDSTAVLTTTDETSPSTTAEPSPTMSNTEVVSTTSASASSSSTTDETGTSESTSTSTSTTASEISSASVTEAPSTTPTSSELPESVTGQLSNSKVVAS